MTGPSWKPEVFDRIYAENPDPWGFVASPYEQAKYADTLAQLSGDQLAGRRFASGLECGCSIGVLTRLLAARCERLLALDAAAAAITQAEARCAGLDHVVVRRATLPHDWPEGTFDLIVISELLYFLDGADIATLARNCERAAPATCTILLVNWTGETDTPTTGDAAATAFRHAVQGFTADAPLHRASYRVDRLSRTEPV